MLRIILWLATAMVAIVPMAAAADPLGDAYGAYAAGAFAEAAKRLLPLAEGGHAGAQLYLGKMYADGEGVVQDYQLSLHWYLKAADQGVAAAQASVGAAYMAGLGVLRDNVLAHLWFTAAAAGGSKIAEQAIVIVLGRMTADEIEAAKALTTLCERRQFRQCSELR
jgi:TPR repeat protein